MINISLCIEMIFSELRWDERIARVKELQAPAFEFWGWKNKDLQQTKALAEQYDLAVAAMVGGGAPLTDPEAKDQAVADILESIERAKALQVPTLIATSGPEQQDLERSVQQTNIIAVLKQVAKPLEDAGITLVLEPLNTAVNHQGIYLASSYEGYEILRAVSSPRVKLLFDIYHQQITEGNIIANIREHVEWIGHFHIADVPGRHEPGTGELHYQNIFQAIAATDYAGYVGCEFRPRGSTEEAVREVLRLAANT